MPSKKRDFGNRLSPKHCKFCNKEFEKYQSASAHSVFCVLNPSRDKTIQKISASSSGRVHTQEAREKISKSILKKVENDEWHCSFSRARIHEYNGIKFHGMWEIKYAQYLDTQNIKWIRPIEQFEYEFEEKIRHYTPDFFLVDLNLYVEIKGYATEKDHQKWMNFPLDLRVLFGEDLLELGILREEEIKKYNNEAKSYGMSLWADNSMVE